jgi:GGDEF domain-containing protein
MDPGIDKPPGCPLTNTDCPLMEALADSRAECKRLQKLSRTDPLSGFFNLRHFQETLEIEMERTRRSGLSTSLIMIDIDHFKQVNDFYGHETGNDALCWASRAFKNNIRRLDVPCRYGGEEFAIILPGHPPGRGGSRCRAAEAGPGSPTVSNTGKHRACHRQFWR